MLPSHSAGSPISLTCTFIYIFRQSRLHMSSLHHSYVHSVRTSAMSAAFRFSLCRRAATASLSAARACISFRAFATRSGWHCQRPIECMKS